MELRTWWEELTPGMKRSDFEFLSLIQKGLGGEVYLVRQRDSGEILAMKLIPKALLFPSDSRIRDSLAERNILAEVHEHPYIVNLHYAFQSPQNLYLITDFANGGDLFDRWTQHQLENPHRPYFPEDVVIFYAAELFLAVHHLHNLGILHRDLKLENVLLDIDGHLALTDFGLSKKLPEGQDGTSTVVGTVNICAPEMLQIRLPEQSRKKYNRAVDWWSYGIMVALMLYGQHPFLTPAEETLIQNPDEEKRSRAIRKFLSAPLLLRTDLASDAAADFVMRLLGKDPTSRLGTRNESEIQDHPFFDGIDWNAMMNRQVDPPWTPRLGPLEIKPETVREIVEAPDSWVNIDRKLILPATQPFAGYDYNIPKPQARSEVIREPGLSPFDTNAETGITKRVLETERRQRRRFAPKKKTRRVARAATGRAKPTRRRARKKRTRRKRRNGTE